MSLFLYSKNQQISKLTHILSLSFDEALVIKWKVLPSLSTYIVLTNAIFSMFAFGALSALQKLRTGAFLPRLSFHGIHNGISLRFLQNASHGAICHLLSLNLKQIVSFLSVLYFCSLQFYLCYGCFCRFVCI